MQALFAAMQSGTGSPRVQYELDAAMACRLIDSDFLSQKLKDWIWVYIRLMEEDEAHTTNRSPADERLIEACEYMKFRSLVLPPPEKYYES